MINLSDKTYKAGSYMVVEVKDVKAFIKEIGEIEPCASQEIFVEKIKEKAGDKLI